MYILILCNNIFYSSTLHYGNIFEDNSPVYDTGEQLFPFYSVHSVYVTGEFFTLFPYI